MESNKATGKIILIPSSLGEGSPDFYTHHSKEIIIAIDYFIVENERTARRFLRSIGYKNDFDKGTMSTVENNNAFVADEKMKLFLVEGKNIGVISEAGCPGIADPGSSVVRWAHQNNFKVVPLIGPSSIFLALMASGLNGQQFAFHGYLPVSSIERKKKLKQLEEESKRKQQTQIFMETPYRNDGLLKDILETLLPTTLLCVASNITTTDEFILTKKVLDWKKLLPDLKKKPAIFLLMAE